MLMPATDMTAVEQALTQCETLVLYKCAKKMKQLLALLNKHGLADSARLVCYAEQSGRQAIFGDLRDAAESSHGYMATVIVYIGRKKWGTVEAERREKNQPIAPPGVVN